MAITAAQYQSMRLAFRIMLSVEGVGPTDGDVLSFAKQLFSDSSGATPLSTVRNFLATEVLRTVLSAATSPVDSDVSDFLTQLATDSGTATPMGLTTPYRSMRNALRSAMSGGGLNPSDADVLSYFAPYAVTLVPISDAFWATGGWWDLSTIAGVAGAQFTANVHAISVGGLGVFTPQSNAATFPIINDTAIGGKRGLLLNSGVVNYLENDALAAIINGSNRTYTVVFDYQDISIGAASVDDRVIVSFGSAQPGSARDLFDTTYLVASTLCNEVIQWTGGHATNTINTTAVSPLFDYYRFALTFDGTTLTTFLNGVAITVTPSTWQNAAMAITRMGWGASMVGAVGFQGANGYIRRLGVRTGAATALQMASIDSNMVANDFTLPVSSALVPTFIVAGASVINGSEDEITGGGVRYVLSQAIQTGKKSFASSGGTQQAFFQNNFTPATGGAGAVEITAQITSSVTSRTKLVIVDLGDEEIDLNQTSAQVITAITTALSSIRAAVYVVAPACAIVVNTIVPLSESARNTVCIAVNAALPGIWNSSDSAFPSNPPLTRWDANTAIGGPSYVQANYNAAGDDHPNHLGYTLMGAAMMTVVNPILNQFSPT